jgi:hypothetical protein
MGTYATCLLYVINTHIYVYKMSKRLMLDKG